VFVLLLDSLHVAPVRTLAVRKYAREFIERHVGLYPRPVSPM
jgi:hypothetical protein